MSQSYRTRLRELVNRTRLLSFGFALLAIVAIMAATEGFVREVIVLPLLYLVWIGQLLFESIPQYVVWNAFVALAALLAARSFRAPPGAPTHASVAALPSGRIEGWAAMLDQAKRDDLSRWRVAQRLGQLTVEVLADRERLTARETRRRLERGNLDIPPEIRSYLQVRMRTSNRRRAPFSRDRGPLFTPPERVVEFLEQTSSKQIGNGP